MSNGHEELHKDVEELLPWYTTGRVGNEEAAQIERALEADARLRRGLEASREDLEATVSVVDAIPVPSARLRQALVAGMNAHPRAARSGGLLDRIAEALRAMAPRRLAYAGMAAAAIILAQGAILGGVFLGDRGGTDGVFQPASVATEGVAPASVDTFVLVAFAPNARAEEITHFLLRYQANIVDGPRAEGMYRVRLAASPANIGDRDPRIDQMRAQSSLIRVALPVR